MENGLERTKGKIWCRYGAALGEDRGYGDDNTCAEETNEGDECWNCCFSR